ncbi:MAG TPA: hypothetical protein VFE65_29335, partial [Pseudonocardia sp.]|nr:hypothetical protein [Pseudonocardia sp.]
TRLVAGKELEQWQYEVTAGGRIWYCPDPDRRIVWLVAASPAHPKRTAASQNDYQFAQGQIAAQLTSAQAAGLLRPVVRPTRLARTLVALITGHRLMCERTHTPHEMPQVIAEMWEVVVPLIATERWLRHLDPSSLDPAVPRRSLAAVAAVRDAATHERTQQ